jgi:hypothetical protein
VATSGAIPFPCAPRTSSHSLVAFDKGVVFQHLRHFLVRRSDTVGAALKPHKVFRTPLESHFVQRVGPFFRENFLVGKSGGVICERLVAFSCEGTFAWVVNGLGSTEGGVAFVRTANPHD